MAYLGGHFIITCRVELLTKNETSVVLKLSGKRFIGLHKLVYLYQAKFLKEVRIDQYYRIPIKVRQYMNIISSHGTDSAFTLATLTRNHLVRKVLVLTLLKPSGYCMYHLL
jgi:hypothetical protein